MSLHKDPELKTAVLQLSQKEKDKLLVRLVGKDKMLLKQLHYELLEDESDLADRIEVLKNKLFELFEKMQAEHKTVRNHRFDKYIGTNIRHANGLVNEHEKITKDKLSDVECRLIILNELFQRFPSLFDQSSYYNAPQLITYIQNRIKAVVTKYEKLHEDIQFDLREPFQSMFDFALEHNLD